MIDILSEIGEVLCLGIGLLFVFSILNSLDSSKSHGRVSSKSGGNNRVFLPLVGGFFGICIGVYLGNIFSETWALVGAISLGLVGIIISISMSKQAQDF